jgi:hypothetical protein
MFCTALRALWNFAAPFASTDGLLLCAPDVDCGGGTWDVFALVAEDEAGTLAAVEAELGGFGTEALAAPEPADAPPDAAGLKTAAPCPAAEKADPMPAPLAGPPAAPAA